jgi:hypothetical protein
LKSFSKNVSVIPAPEEAIVDRSCESSEVDSVDDFAVDAAFPAADVVAGEAVGTPVDGPGVDSVLSEATSAGTCDDEDAEEVAECTRASVEGNDEEAPVDCVTPEVVGKSVGVRLAGEDDKTASLAVSVVAWSASTSEVESVGERAV